MYNKTKRQRLELVRAELKQQRTAMEPAWKDVGEYIPASRPSFCLKSTHVQDRRNTGILDNTATEASNVLSSGMMSGFTNPSRNWFRLTTPDPETAEIQRVKDWLFSFQRLMSGFFLKSNLYDILNGFYSTLGDFATAAFIIEEDFETVIHCTEIELGSYWIANDAKGDVRTFHREFSMTVRQLIEKFGYEGRPFDGPPDLSVFSERVQQAYKDEKWDMFIDVGHAIYPNPKWNPNGLLSKDKRYSSDYYELSNPADNKFLRERGYDEFPLIICRWKVSGSNPWGIDSPGLRAIGDVKQLQFGERLGLKGLERNMDPPMGAPESMRGQPSSTIPGKITYGSDIEKFKPLFDINPRLPELDAKQDKVRGRINKTYYNDVMMRITNDARSQRATAREIDVGEQEKYLVLGPVLTRLDKDALSRIIAITANFMFQQYLKPGIPEDKKLIPDPPEELQGVDLKVEYISVIAAAQKAQGTGAMNQLLQIVGSVAQISPQSADKFDGDQFVDEYSENLGTSPRVIRSDEAVAEMRQAQAQAQAQQQQAASVQSMLGAAKDLSQTNTSGDNALSAILSGGGQ